MSSAKIKWLLRLGLPAGCIAVSILCGKTLGGAIGVLISTALIMVLLAAAPFLIVGFVFVPVLALYGVKMDEGDRGLDLNDPETRMFLWLGIPAGLGMSALLSL